MNDNDLSINYININIGSLGFNDFFLAKIILPVMCAGIVILM